VILFVGISTGAGVASIMVAGAPAHMHGLPRARLSQKRVGVAVDREGGADEELGAEELGATAGSGQGARVLRPIRR
jgi:hypothetical protein